MDTRTNGHTPLILAAKAVGKSYQATHRLILIGKLAGDQIAGKWFVETADLDRYVREHSPTTEEKSA